MGDVSKEWERTKKNFTNEANRAGNNISSNLTTVSQDLGLGSVKDLEATASNIGRAALSAGTMGLSEVANNMTAGNMFAGTKAEAGLAGAGFNAASNPLGVGGATALASASNTMSAENKYQTRQANEKAAAEAERKAADNAAAIQAENAAMKKSAERDAAERRRRTGRKSSLLSGSEAGMTSAQLLG